MELSLPSISTIEGFSNQMFVSTFILFLIQISVSYGLFIAVKRMSRSNHSFYLLKDIHRMLKGNNVKDYTNSETCKEVEEFLKEQQKQNIW